MTESYPELLERRTRLQAILDSGVMQVGSGQGRTLTYRDRSDLQLQIDDLTLRMDVLTNAPAAGRRIRRVSLHLHRDL